MRTTKSITVSIPAELYQEILVYLAKKYPVATFSKAIADMLAQAMKQDKKENE